MQFCIHQKILGSEKHLVCARDEKRNLIWSWHSRLPDQTWILGDSSSPRDIRQLLLILHKELPISAKIAAHIRSLSEISSSTVGLGDFPLKFLLAADELKRFSQDLGRFFFSLYDNYPDRYYWDTFPLIRQPLLELQPAKIDTRAIKRAIVDDLETQKSVLRSFLPQEDSGFLEPPTYNHDTTTGRLGVATGPQILTLKRDSRKFIVPRKDSNVITLMDYVSLEPRVLLEAVDKKPSLDIYGDIESTILPNLERKKIKISVMGSLFGISPTTLAQKLEIDRDKAEQIINAIRNFFDLRSLEVRLLDQYDHLGYISNFFGRRLQLPKRDPRIAVAYYVQSSGVDAALLGFGQLFNLLKPLDIVPLYVIHDAVVLDVPKDNLQYLEKISAAGIQIQGMKNPFPLTYD